MLPYDDIALRERLRIANDRPFVERLELAPNLVMKHRVNGMLSIRHSVEDEYLIRDVGSMLNRAYEYTLEWFEVREVFEIEVWLASELRDLHYMTCMKCAEGSAFAPGWNRGKAVIICQSPRTSVRNRDEGRMTSILVHEISHFVVRQLSGASDYTRERRERQEIPMWLEEGLCLVAQADFRAELKGMFSELCQEIEDPHGSLYDETGRGEATECLPKPYNSMVGCGFSTHGNWYNINELWNDLSECEDVSKAYAQSFQEVALLQEKVGRDGILELVRSYKHRTIKR